jgi:two-component system, LuxR family, sensor kinase FixL
MKTRSGSSVRAFWHRHTWLLAAGYLCVFVALDWASYIRPLQGLNITPWNPQPAVAIALLIWNRRWIWLVWVGLVVAELTVRGAPTNWPAVWVATVALTLAYAAIAVALAQGLDLSKIFGTRRDLARFAGIATIGALVNAILYVLAFSAGGFGPQGSALGAAARYWVGDAVGLLVTLPILLLWMDRQRRAALRALLRNVEWWLTVAMACAFLWVVFGRGFQDYFKFFYLLLVPVVWAAARFGVAGAVLTCAVTQLGLIASSQVALEHDLTLFELQALMAATAMTALLVGILVDERARATTELRGSLRFAAAGQMAAALAHELIQPLTALSNYAHVSRMLTAPAQPLNDEQRKHLDEATLRIAQEAQRAGDVVRRLRNFFTTGAASLQLMQAHIALGEAVEGHVGLARKLGVNISSEFEADLPAVWMDPLQVGVVLRNLIVNAIEAAAVAGGEKQVWVSAQRDREGILISVQDSGAGVDPSRLPSLFDAVPSVKPDGMGVGLSICRAMVDTHGGKLWAESGPRGKFCFTLPVPQ